MNFITVTPNSKGQITIPIDLRNKYGVTEKTPLLIKDKNGAIEIQVIKHIETEDVWDEERRKKLLELAKKLKGSWADDKDYEKRAKRQRKIELVAARRIREAW